MERSSQRIEFGKEEELAMERTIQRAEFSKEELAMERNIQRAGFSKEEELVTERTNPL